jgi:hypothetical protein
MTDLVVRRSELTDEGCQVDCGLLGPDRVGAMQVPGLVTVGVMEEQQVSAVHGLEAGVDVAPGVGGDASRARGIGAVQVAGGGPVGVWIAQEHSEPTASRGEVGYLPTVQREHGTTAGGKSEELLDSDPFRGHGHGGALR